MYEGLFRIPIRIQSRVIWWKITSLRVRIGEYTTWASYLPGIPRLPVWSHVLWHASAWALSYHSCPHLLCLSFSSPSRFEPLHPCVNPTRIVCPTSLCHEHGGALRAILDAEKKTKTFSDMLIDLLRNPIGNLLQFSRPHRFWPKTRHRIWPRKNHWLSLETMESLRARDCCQKHRTYPWYL